MSGTRFALEIGDVRIDIAQFTLYHAETVGDESRRGHCHLLFVKTPFLIIYLDERIEEINLPLHAYILHREVYHRCILVGKAYVELLLIVGYGGRHRHERDIDRMREIGAEISAGLQDYASGWRSDSITECHCIGFVVLLLILLDVRNLHLATVYQLGLEKHSVVRLGIGE